MSATVADGSRGAVNLSAIRAHGSRLTGRKASAPEWGLGEMCFRAKRASEVADHERLAKEDVGLAAVVAVIRWTVWPDGGAVFTDDGATRAALLSADADVLMRLFSAAVGTGGAEAVEEKKD
jgi:hypothetical protein